VLNFIAIDNCTRYSRLHKSHFLAHSVVEFSIAWDGGLNSVNDGIIRLSGHRNIRTVQLVV